MINLKAQPFNLNEKARKWVENTYDAMTIEERIGQLFCPIVFTGNPKELEDLVRTKHIGGMLYREGQGKEIRHNIDILQNASKLPLLVASNLEYGGTGSAVEGTYFGRQMLIAATDDVEKAYQLGKVSCSEGAAVGVNWSFAPVVDIDYNFRNPITNVRTYGDDPEKVLTMGKAYMKGAKEEGVAVSIKHFPGDGVDERDQHLLTSVNTMTVEEWDNSFGQIYQGLIDEGALTVMAGHIGLPAYEEHFGAEGDQGIIPATLSSNLLNKLLREKLGFNGMICTDATPMVGFCAAMERSQSVPYSIEAGCDIFLFNKDLEEDYGFMMAGYQEGRLSERRLKEANYRILATKAALGLHEKQAEDTLVPEEDSLLLLNNETHDQWAVECADMGVTLVKDTAHLIPIKVQQHKRILLEMIGDYPSNDRVYDQFEGLLAGKGYEVTRYIPEDFSKPLDTIGDFRAKYDLVVYIGNIETASNKTVARINWFTLFGLGNNMPWFVKEVPTLFISVGNPYHLMDVPMVQTYINGYCNSSYVIDAVVEKITGGSEFKGVSPIDPFCGRRDTRY